MRVASSSSPNGGARSLRMVQRTALDELCILRHVHVRLLLAKIGAARKGTDRQRSIDTDDEAYPVAACTACRQLHLLHPATSKALDYTKGEYESPCRLPTMWGAAHCPPGTNSGIPASRRCCSAG